MTVESAEETLPVLKYVSAKYGLNLRDKSSTQGEIIKIMAWAEVVEIVEDGDWPLLKSGDDTGYASNRYLSDENPSI